MVNQSPESEARERKLAVEALRESEERFRQVFEEAPLALCVLGPDKALLRVNRAFCHMVGYEASELIGQTYALYTHPDDLVQNVTLTDRFYRGETNRYSLEKRYLPKTGKQIWVRVTATEMIDPVIQERVVLAAVEDITGYREALDKDEASRRMLEAITRIQAQVIADADVQTAFDNMLAELLSLTRSEYGFIGEILTTTEGESYLKTHAITNIAWNEETRALYNRMAPNLEFFNLQTLFGEVITTGKTVIANHPSADPRSGGLPQGHPPMNAFLGLPFYRGETLVGMVGIANRPGGYDQAVVDYIQPFLGTCATIVEAYRNDQRRRSAEVALREALERFDLGVRGSSDGLWDGRLLPDEPWHAPLTPVWWSPRFKQLLGYDENDFPNVLESWTSRLHPEDKPRVFAALEAHMERRVPYDEEYRLLTKQGEYRWCRARGQAIWDAAGRPLRMSGSLTDITERKKLEEQLIHSQRMQAVGQLAGGIAHDFNNLLTVINGYSDMISSCSMPADTVKQAATEVKKAGARAAALTHQLLAFSRKQILSPTTINVNAVVENLMRMLERVIGEHIHLATTLSPALWPVEADVGQFEQVIMNLAVNARDAMPDGGRLTIETTNVEMAEALGPRRGQVYGPIQPIPYVRLAVSDTGVGMNEATQKQVFEPFFTTKEVGKGTGLGLAMVYGVVTQSGGFMEMVSAPLEGSTFMVYLPCSNQITQIHDRPTPTSSVPTGTETILLVEDEDIVRTFLRDVLAKAGYRVLEAANGEDALQVCRQDQIPIHLVIADVIMPGMTGRNLAEQMIAVQPAICILFISGYAPDSVLLQGFPRGKAGFLYKPFVSDTLLQKVREVLDR